MTSVYRNANNQTFQEWLKDNKGVVKAKKDLRETQISLHNFRADHLEKRKSYNGMIKEASKEAKRRDSVGGSKKKRKSKRKSKQCKHCKLRY